MPGKGRNLPKLDGEHLIHLRMVYDTRHEKKIFRYAYWHPAMNKWATNPCKDKALVLSKTANSSGCEETNWRPPCDFYKEGHTLAIDKENVPVPRALGTWCSSPLEHSSLRSQQSRKTKSTRSSSSGASSASSGPPSDVSERKEWERSQKVKKSMQKMLKKQREKANKTARKLARTTEKLLLTELARSNQQNNSRASEVLRAIQASTNEVIDNAAEVAKAAAMATREVLDKVIEGSDQAELGRLEAEEQRLQDQEQRLQDLVAKAAAKKLKFEEKQARDLTQKAVRDADAQAANTALVAAIGKQVGVAVKGEVGEVVEAVNAVGKQVDAAAEFAALGANAALEAANASKDAKEAIGALTSTFAGRMTEVLTVVLRREKTIKCMLEDPVGVNETRSIEDDPTIKQELALIKQSIADLRPQRAAPASQCTAPGQRAGSVPMRKPTSAPAPARSTRSATTGTRSGGATATTHSSQAARREQAPALKKGVLASKVSLAVEALAGDKKDGAYLKKIAALAEVPQLLLRAQKEDQLMAALAALTKGISSALVGKTAANESQLIAAALAAIYAIYSSLEPNSNEMELVAAWLVPDLLKATEKKVQGARQWSPKFGETAAALVALSATQRLLECMLSKLCTKERSGDTECLWAAKALGSYVRATPQQVEPATPEMYAVSRGLLLLLGHKNVLVREAAILSVCDLAKVNKELATSLSAEVKQTISKQLAEKLDRAIEEATAHYTAVDLGSPHSA